MDEPQGPAGGNAEQPRRLVEWHTMDEAEREQAWAQLREWVTWLHDRYELGVEERLPPCWAEHPGLIEELWALRAWRQEIYGDEQPSGQAARYWHAEMRQTIGAALTFYAVGCRAGHRGATGLAATSTDLQHRWSAADPIAGIPQAMLAAATDRPSIEEHLLMERAVMDGHLASGEAAPMSQTVHDLVFYDGSWWTLAPLGWLRVTDPDLADRLDRRAATLAEADAAVAARSADRAPATDIDPAGR